MNEALKELEDIIANDCLAPASRLEKFKEWKDKHLHVVSGQRLVSPMDVMLYKGWGKTEDALQRLSIYLVQDLQREIAMSPFADIKIEPQEDGGLLHKVSVVTIK